MGDVVTALARAVQEEGHEVEVVLPKYDIINYDEVSSLLQAPFSKESLCNLLLLQLTVTLLLSCMPPASMSFTGSSQ